MMLLWTVVVGLALWGSPVEAIRWDFDDGTTQGWTAKETPTWGGTREFNLFPGEVEDGMWRIRVSPAVTNILYASAPGVASSTIRCAIGRCMAASISTWRASVEMRSGSASA